MKYLRKTRIEMLFMLIIMICSITCVFRCIENNSYVVKAENFEEKVYPSIKYDDNFADDTVIIVLDKEETFKFKEYSEKDFQEIGCIFAMNLMENTEKLVKKQLEAKKNNDWKELQPYIDNNMLVDLQAYRGLWKLMLAEKSKDNVIKAINILIKKPGIKTAEPDYIQTINAIHPNSSNLRTQWALDNINIDKAWDRSTGSSNVLVGVMDSGIDSTHHDLTNRIQYDLCADFLNDFSNELDLNPTDVYGHGTHVAGIIGAKGVNSGITGVCWNIRLVSLRVFDSEGSSMTTRIARAVDYAMGNNISIVNYSGGGSIPYIISNIVVFDNYPGLLVCSAGNNDRNNDENYFYPSHYSSSSNRIISVGAIKSDDTRATVYDWGYDKNGNPQGSNYGASSVSLFAPGDDIISTVPTSVCSSGYISWFGTSMATPYVTGVAALMKSYNNKLTSAQIKKLIMDNVDYVSSLEGLCVTNGKLNAGKVLFATFKTKEIFNWYGYQGEAFYWRGKVDMYYSGDNIFNASGMMIVEDDSMIGFEINVVDSNNLVLLMDGTVSFSLKNSSGSVIQTHTSTISVDLLSQSDIYNASFFVDTSDLPVDTYTLSLSSYFTRGPSYEESHTLNWTFAVNRPVEVMDGFGYLSSWYQWKGDVEFSNEYLYSYSKDSSNRYIINKNNTDLEFEIGTSLSFNAVKEMTGYVIMELVNSADETVEDHYCSVRVGLVSNVTLSNSVFIINTADYQNDTYTIYLYCSMTRNGTTYSNSASYSFVLNKPTSSGGGACITEGTLITLADGTKTAVENLTGDEELLVWDMLNGTFTSAPILFIDSEETTTYDVITLTFSDGTQVEVIDEHAFFDTTLNKYVFLRNDASQYIGHYFKKQSYDLNNNMVLLDVQLLDVTITQQVTTAYSPVTYGHLCYYVNGMLSMPGNTESFINIFDVDSTIMSYDQTSMAQDISIYGLYSYEEFNNIIPIPEFIFDAFNGQYLRIAIGKGITTLEEIQCLLDRYYYL